jgi:hypothetical protein
LRTLYQFATDMNCHVQVLAHPAKMDGARRPDLKCPTRTDGFQNKIERSKGERWRTRGVVTPAAWIITMIQHTDCCANKTRWCD